MSGWRKLPLAMLGASAAMWAIVGGLAVAGRAPDWLLVAAGVAVVVQALSLLLIGPVRAMAWQTFRQCLRMKIAAAFMALLALVLVALPAITVGGDNMLSARIRTFLDYSVSLTAVLLSIVTIFLSVAVISNDVRTKQVFSVASKPVARWQYIVGRWLGVMGLSGLLLAISAGAIFAVATHMRSLKTDPMTGQQISPDDRRQIESEIFVSRKRIGPRPLDLDAAVQERARELQKTGRWNEMLQSHISQAGGDTEVGLLKLYDTIRKERSAELQSAAPGEMMEWQFEGIRVAGGQLELDSRLLDHAPDKSLLLLSSEPSLVGSLVLGAPISVEGVTAHVQAIERDRFLVRVAPAELSSSAISLMARDKPVAVVIDPFIQITYKASPGSSPPGNTLRSQWWIIRPSLGAQQTIAYREERNDPIKTPGTLTVPSRMVNEQGQLTVRYYNVPGRDGFATSVTILNSDMAVLYRVGGFAGNFVLAVALVLVQLAFLAAVGVFAGSFLSFPVGCLLSFPVLAIGMASGFLLDAAQPMDEAGASEAFNQFSYWLIRGVSLLVPDFGKTITGDMLAEGMQLAWPMVGQTTFVILGVQTVILLAMACAIFHRRELASVQV